MDGIRKASPAGRLARLHQLRTARANDRVQYQYTQPPRPRQYRNYQERDARAFRWLIVDAFLAFGSRTGWVTSRWYVDQNGALRHYRERRGTR